jgi:hypothetical protein
MDPFLQLWPSLGLLESLLWRSKQVNSAIIYHDPVPLRRQFGYGGIAHAAVRLSRIGRSPLIVTHSDDADAELTQTFPAHDRVSVSHPILSLQENGERDSEEILVAGQFKPVRDLEILGALGPALRKRGFRPRIVGRGWPADIRGWDVHNLFVAEEDLSERLSIARVVVVPYKRYFQSNIAVRALEMGTVSVTPPTSFARDLFGTDSPAIVQRPDVVEDWLRAIDAVSSGKVEAETTFDSYIERCDISWRAFLNRLGTSRLA